MENSNCNCGCSVPNKPSGKYPTMSVAVFAEEITEPDVYLLDVRHPDEFASGHIANAHNIDVLSDDFMEVAEKTLPKDETIAVYCGSGKRSAMASEKLALAGYSIVNLDGGLAAWKEAGQPIVN